MIELMHTYWCKDDEIHKDLDKLLSLREALNKIKDKERVVIMKRYYYGMSQSEIADELSISQAQDSRIENSAINSVKKLITSNISEKIFVSE